LLALAQRSHLVFAICLQGTDENEDGHTVSSWRCSLLCWHAALFLLVLACLPGSLAGALLTLHPHSFFLPCSTLNTRQCRSEPCLAIKTSWGTQVRKFALLTRDVLPAVIALQALFISC
jgi:hypothetical protein